MKKYSLYLILTLLILSCSCSRKKPVSPVLRTVPEGSVQSSQTSQQPQEEFLFHAYAKGNRVFVVIQNNLNKPLKITPFDFALRINDETIRFAHDKCRCEFPIGTLNPGMESQGWFTYYDKSSLTGHKFIFNNPEYKPLITIIGDYTAIE